MPYFKNLSKDDFKNLLPENADANEINTAFDNGIAIAEAMSEDAPDTVKILRDEKTAFLIHSIISVTHEDYFAQGILNDNVNWNENESPALDDIRSRIEGDNLQSIQYDMVSAYLDELVGDDRQAMNDILERFSPADIWNNRKIISDALIGNRMLPLPNLQTVPVNENGKIVEQDKIINEAQIETENMKIQESKGTLNLYIENAKQGLPLEGSYANQPINYRPEDYEQVPEINQDENIQKKDRVYQDQSGNYNITRRLAGYDDHDLLRAFGRVNISLQDKKDFMLSYLYRDKSDDEFAKIAEGIQKNPDAQKIVNDLAQYATLNDLTDANSSLAPDLETYIKNPRAINVLMQHVNRIKEAGEKFEQEMEEYDRIIDENDVSVLDVKEGEVLLVMSCASVSHLIENIEKRYNKKD